MEATLTICTLFAAFFVAALTIGTCHESVAGTPTYNLRTDPATPIAGQSFQVVADGNSCELLFVANPYGDGVYDEVTVSRGLIQAQVGYNRTLVPPCENPPHTVGLTIPGQPAGEYRVELIGRQFFSTDEGLLQAINITIAGGVATGAPVVVPASDLNGLLMLSALVFLLGVLALPRRS